jgi:hypothetical protein
MARRTDPTTNPTFARLPRLLQASLESSSDSRRHAGQGVIRAAMGLARVMTVEVPGRTGKNLATFGAGGLGGAGALMLGSDNKLVQGAGAALEVAAVLYGIKQIPEGPTTHQYNTRGVEAERNGLRRAIAHFGTEMGYDMNATAPRDRVAVGTRIEMAVLNAALDSPTDLAKLGADRGPGLFR